MRNRNYMEVTVFVAADDNEQNICVRNETLDGKRGMVKLFVRSPKKGGADQDLGYFNVKDLIAAINTAANADIPYLVEQLANDRHRAEAKIGYAAEKHDRSEF